MAVWFAQGLGLASIAIAFLLSHASSTSASNIIHDGQALQKRNTTYDERDYYKFAQPIVHSMELLRENMCAACISAAVYMSDEELAGEIDWREYLKPSQRKSLSLVMPSVEEIIREQGGGPVRRRKARFECSDVLRKYIEEIIERELNREDPESGENIFNFIGTMDDSFELFDPKSVDWELIDRPQQIAVLEEFREYFESESGEIVYNCVEALHWWAWDEDM